MATKVRMVMQTFHPEAGGRCLEGAEIVIPTKLADWWEERGIAEIIEEDVPESERTVRQRPDAGLRDQMRPDQAPEPPQAKRQPARRVTRPDARKAAEPKADGEGGHYSDVVDRDAVEGKTPAK